MIEVTQKKLREAKFFLRKLIYASQTLVGEEAEAFPYYLSAFLSAGRSVTFALQAEEKEKYDAWFQRWLAAQTENRRQLFQFMKGQRNVVLKRGRGEVTQSLEFVPLVKASPAERRQAVAFQWFGPPGDPPPAVPRRVRHFDLSGTPKEVTASCSEYFKLLEELVGEFLRTHGPPA